MKPIELMPGFQRWNPITQVLAMMAPMHVVFATTPFNLTLYGNDSTLRISWETDGSGREVVEDYRSDGDRTVHHASLTEEQIIEICLQWLASEV